jgi:hypothetical protein
MTDIIYNVLTRPIPSDPDKIDAYHLAKVAKDAKVKRIEDDDPNADQEKPKKNNKHNKGETKGLSKEQGKESDVNDHGERVNEDEHGRGKYKDKDGVEHLDIFV